MRKRSSYKPRGVRLDNMSWVKAGLKPVGSVRARWSGSVSSARPRRGDSTFTRTG